MGFRSISDCVDDVAGVLRNIKVDANKQLFAEVKLAAAASYEHLLKLLPTLSKTPTAVVVIGPGEYHESQGGREYGTAVVVIDRMRSGSDARSVHIWNLAERVLARFEPQGRGGYVEIENVQYTPRSWRPLSINGDYAAMLIELDTLVPRTY